ncbi:hypothetical protein ACIGJO_10600 [Streptomyces sp. NPDC079020]|uniref:hypothetical protein n=1 Tax=Streptomyces sp. NPDC079020 TaxID=3365722 RepID=UPI0037D02904
MAWAKLQRLFVADASYTLITNGTRVRTHRSWLARTHLDKVKVSLHHFSDASLRATASGSTRSWTASRSPARSSNGSS